MSSHLCITIRFLDPEPNFHGRGSSDSPEWPASPLRLFQALVAAAATRWRDKLFGEYARPALEWLESKRPTIVAPATTAESYGFRMYVPNNSGDLMTAAWARGDTDTSMAKFRVEKDVRPTRLSGEAVHYLYPLAESDPGFAAHEQTLVAAARSVTHLGWGVDMVAGNAGVLDDGAVAKLEGERWHPVTDGSGTPLRVPRPGTLDALVTKHAAFLNRLGPDGFKPVPPLTTFDTVGYRRATDPVARPFAAFELHRPLHELDALPAGRSTFRPFDATRWTGAVAGMVRHATDVAARTAGRPIDWVNGYVHGHTADGTQPARGEGADARFMYLPLPSVEFRKDRGTHIGMVRRVLVVGPPGGREEVDWARRVLNGQELFAEGQPAPVAALAAIPSADKNVQHYVGKSQTWSTVTPAILPGHDEASPGVVARRVEMASGEEARRHVRAQAEQRTRDLLLSAFRHAGLADELVRHAELEWRPVGFRAGVGMARQYHVPETLRKWPAYHVRVRFPTPVQGPLAVGAGRYRGFGLFAGDRGPTE